MKHNYLSLTKSENNAFWVFSNTVYQQRTIAQTALHFQDNWGLSINFLLFCSFCSLENKQLTQQVTQHLWQQLSHWNREYTLQIRKLRQRLKLFGKNEETKQLYHAIKQIELQFEYQEQQLLFKQFDRFSQANQKNINDLFITNTSLYLNQVNQYPLPKLLAELTTWFKEVTLYWESIEKKID